MDGFVEPSMPRLPSVINVIKETPAPPTGQPQQKKFSVKAKFSLGFNSEKRRSSYDDKEFAAVAEARRPTFNHLKSGSGDENVEDDGSKQMAKTMFGKMLLSAPQKSDIAEAFNAFDVTGTGFMSMVDLRVALKALGFEARKEEMQKLLEEYDTGNSGRLCYIDFMNIIEQKLGENDSRDDLMKTFNLFDKDRQGRITFQNLKEVVHELGEDINDEEIAETIAEADLDDDGTVNDEEFLKILKKESLYWRNKYWRNKNQSFQIGFTFHFHPVHNKHN